MKYFSLYEAAIITGIPKQTLYTRLQQGKLKYTDINISPTYAFEAITMESLREFCKNELETVQLNIQILEKQRAGLTAFLALPDVEYNSI